MILIIISRWDYKPTNRTGGNHPVGKGTISIHQIVEILPLVWQMTTVTARREIADWWFQRYSMFNPFFWGWAWSQLIDVVFLFFSPFFYL